MVTIRAFRSVDDPEACERFIEGHRRVLEAHGVKKVTSSNNDWKDNPAVFVVNVESQDKQKVYGGARIHVADGKHPLPIELATGYLDSSIYNRVFQERRQGTAELCGLWNSIEVAGMGIGSFFATRAAVVITQQIGIKALWGLCAPYTVRWAQRLGSEIVKDIGNQGTFYYPRLDLIATVVLMRDTEDLQSIRPYESQKILSLRQQPNQILFEPPPGKRQEVEIKYELLLPSARKDEYVYPNLSEREIWPFEENRMEQLPEF
jgi:hypothetical protein